MSSDETKMVVSLACDPSYTLSDGHWNPLAARQWLLAAESGQPDPYHNDITTEHEDNETKVFLFVNDLVAFLREYCLYDDLTPNHGVLGRWLSLMHRDCVQLAEITPEVWDRILSTNVIRKMRT
jgi:hypothetical protein